MSDRLLRSKEKNYAKLNQIHYLIKWKLVITQLRTNNLYIFNVIITFFSRHKDTCSSAERHRDFRKNHSAYRGYSMVCNLFHGWDRIFYIFTSAKRLTCLLHFLWFLFFFQILNIACNTLRDVTIVCYFDTVKITFF